MDKIIDSRRTGEPANGIGGREGAVAGVGRKILYHSKPI